MLKCRSSTKLKNRDYFTKRSNIDIMSSILICAKCEESKTHIMYKCNLSFRQFREYVNILLELGLLDSQLSEDKKKQTLKSTSKGLEFLTKYTELKALMNLDFSRD